MKSVLLLLVQHLNLTQDLLRLHSFLVARGSIDMRELV